MSFKGITGAQDGQKIDGGKYFLPDFLEIWNVNVESNSKNFLFLGIFLIFIIENELGS